jgi:hypothetical protein
VAGVDGVLLIAPAATVAAASAVSFMIRVIKLSLSQSSMAASAMGLVASGRIIMRKADLAVGVRKSQKFQICGRMSVRLPGLVKRSERYSLTFDIPDDLNRVFSTVTVTLAIQ